ncbi:hypothetical protein [Alkalibacterium pelagium]|uniref:Lipoprotein n=1 Tax=Alkalibacterium pelagium TaxID=426702 RepID=A0A1H7NV09_9LACT|nr:hypothetical protein [Alkalibacterium pelagium]GEN51500.1 hypothetical protein APE02nite_21650 [Alkalibacterium pelagium]SEL27292.1 hypothetical protein SAMN04488099_11615 [Alkalibacterium pelagium]
MSYKKLLGLLAVSTLALAACDTDGDPSPTPDIDEEEVEDDAEVEDVEETPEDDTDEDAGNGESAHDIIDGIGSDLGYTASIELEIVGGTWSQEGYVFTPEDGEATVNGSAVGEGDVYAYVLQDGEVVETPAVEEGAFSFTVEATDSDQEYQVGVSEEELYEVGDEADVEEFVRFENIIILAPGE